MSLKTTLTDKTLVLDLDNCLLTSFFNDKSLDESLDAEAASNHLVTDLKNQDLRRRFYRVKLKNEECCGARRENLDAFLSFSFNYFKHVIVWSAGDKEYVHAMVKEIFKGHHQPDYILTRDDIVNVNKHDYYKPLRVIESKYPGVAPLTKTIFVDDKEDNFREDPGNGFTIPQCKIYAKDEKIVTKKDTALLSLMNWLSRKEVISAKDVTKLDKKNAFMYSSNNEVEKKPNNTHITHVMFYAPMSHKTHAR
jgi:TFIIF-interacting CTD phosphatase-like protein